jgi:uncharacterized protein with ATP-grasp and redox domains
MKIKPECLPCLMDRAQFECDRLFREESEKFAALREVIRFLSTHLETDELHSPPFYGTERERILQRRSGIHDPHAAAKRLNNALARSLLPAAERFFEAAADKLEAVIRIAAAANSMEYGVKGYEYSEARFAQIFDRTLHEQLVWNRAEILAAIRAHERILYLTDNAGEIVFDVFVVRKLVNLGKAVVISPKSAPVLNDATVEDLKEAGISGSEVRIRIVPSGAYIGLSLEEATETFLDVFQDERYLVMAKGMGNYEAISEFETRADLRLKGRLLYILRAKCEPVARSLGVNRGDLVARLIT